MASGLTPTYLIPFPLATDPVDVHGDVQDLAERVDDVLGLKAGTDEANTFTYPQIITINSASTALRVTQTGAGNIVLFEDAANPDTTPFVIDNAGNVGIGLTTPTEKLDVVGNIKTTGSIIFEGTQDAYELTLTTSDPLADNTITFPSSTGTVALTNNKLSDFAATTSAELKTVISDETGTGLLVFNDGPTINNLNLTGQVTGLELAFGNSIVFEGTTADDYELTLTAGDPTADRTVTLPNATTTLVGKDTTDVLTNKTLSDATTFIVDSVDNTKKINIDVTGTSGITGVLQTAFTSAKTVSFPDSTGTVALTNNKLSDFASTTSSELAGVISDETGTGALVFANTPTLVTPVLGVASATSINKVAITTPATGSTITVADGKTLTASNTLTFTGTDASSVAFGTGGTVAYTENKLSVFAATTSTELAGVISDETGSGSLVFANTPTLITPVLGVATATSINGTSIPSSKTLVVTTDIGSSVQAWDADLDSIAALAGTAGFLKKTSTNTWTLDTTSYLSGVVAIASGGTGQTTANAALNALLPSQTTATNKYLMSNGTDAAWTTVDALPSQTGNTGKYLTTDGTTASWAIVDLLPSQAGNSGKFLTTNGTVASWALTSGGYAQSSPPASPAEGAVWLDTDGSTSPISVQVYRWTKTVSSTTTTFTGNGDESTALAYIPGTEYVYLNGVMLIRGSDYTASNGSDIVLNVAAVAGDIFQVVLVSSVNIVALATLATTPPVTSTAGEVWMDTDGSITTSQNIRWSILPSAGTTLLTGLDTNSNRLQYVVGNEQVFQNGVLLSRANDYTATNGISITLDSATVAGDVIDVFCNAAIVVADTYSTTQSDNKYVYQTGYQVAGKNKIINGDFAVNQRNFTTNTSSGSFNFDRFYQINADGSFTVTPQTFTLGAAPVAGYEGKNFTRGVVAGQSLASAQASFRQNMESVRTLAGQTATVSFWAKAGSGTPSMNVVLLQLFGSGGSPSSQVATTSTKTSISTSWTRYSFTIDVPSISGKTIGTNNDDYLRLEIWCSAGSDFNSRSGNLGIQNNTFDIWGVQVEAGNQMTSFSTASGSIGGELALCQRYYQRFPNVDGSNGAGLIGFGIGYSTTIAEVSIPLRVTMRAAPTVLDVGTIRVGDSTNNIVVSTTTLVSSQTTQNNVFLSVTVPSGIVQYRPYYLNPSAGYIAFGAEF
jgi:hypothetical protein